MNRRVASRVLMIVAGVLGAVSIAGLITITVFGAAAEQYGSYGEVPIPGSGEVRLPAGETIVSFHVGASGGRGLRVPPLNFDVTPPPGGADPTVTEDLGATVTVNDDAHRRVWFMQVPAAGDYRIITKGEVNGFVEPRLAFGRTRSLEGPLWVLAVLSMVSVDLFIAALWFSRRRGTPVAAQPGTVEAYVPSGEGVRREQLKTISALRDSGALTEKEFREEKRRILDGR